MKREMNMPNHNILLLALAACVGLVAAAPPQPDAPDELVRRGNVAFRAGDKAAADALYARAEERTADPGLVAFNRGAVAFDCDRLRDAEEYYARALQDAACPPDRAAKAWYNRGTCLLWRGGSIDVYRAAVACFEHTLDSGAADDHLKARARDNLVRAKLLWAEERKKAANEKKTPNDDIPREEQDRPKPPPESRGDDEPGPGNPTAPKGTAPASIAQHADGTTEAAKTDQTVAGNNATLQPLLDADQVQPLSEQDARANLAAAAKRIQREQRSLLRTLYGPVRPDVRDW